MATTDFDDWLQQYEPASDDEAFQLHHALQYEETCGVYEVDKKPPQLFVRVGDGDWLRLVSLQALNAFKARADAYCPDPDIGWEGSASYRRAMAKDD